MKFPKVHENKKFPKSSWKQAITEGLKKKCQCQDSKEACGEISKENSAEISEWTKEAYDVKNVEKIIKTYFKIKKKHRAVKAIAKRVFLKKFLQKK